MYFFNLRTNQGLYFYNLIEEIIADDRESLIIALESVEKYLEKGFHVAGYVSYEAGYYLLSKQIQNRHLTTLPLLHFKVFKNAQKIFEIPKAQNNVYLHDIKYSENKQKYLQKFDKIKDHIKNGDTYQLNYSMRIEFNCNASAINLYYELSQRQNAEFSAFLDFDKYSIISLSPELWIKREGNNLIAKPMKGTICATSDNVQNLILISQLQNDSKIIAENSIIVDLIRNDMSVIATPGSVKVTKPFEVQTFNTVNQMISTVECKIKSDTTALEIFKALFPGGSITGAPKIRTMQIINQLEDSARETYCGAIGYFMPNKDFCFNIGIRTVLYDKITKTGKMGIGGGIIHDSEINEEFEECILKSQFLRNINNTFEIFETMKCENGIIHLLNQHLNRLCKTAEFFGFNYNLSNIKTKINNSLKNGRVRLSVTQNGNIIIKHSAIEPQISDKICVSKIIVDNDNIFLRYKTTNREIYNLEYKKYYDLGFVDTVFINKNGYISEGSRHNIFVKNQANQLITPFVKDGALNGIYRDKIIHELGVLERHITLADLENASEIFLSNAVYGLFKVRLAD